MLADKVPVSYCPVPDENKHSDCRPSFPCSSTHTVVNLAEAKTDIHKAQDLLYLGYLAYSLILKGCLSICSHKG